MNNSKITIEAKNYGDSIKVEILPKDGINLNCEPKTIEKLIKKHN